MKKTRIGDTDVPVIGQGTYGFGGFFERCYGNDEELAADLKLGYSLGMILVDTAEVYGDGRSEEIVGKSLLSESRNDLFIATKVWKSRLAYEDVLKSCAKSLNRLKTSYIDLYQVHWPNPSIPIKETMRAFERLMDEGKIRNIGVSNFSVSQVQEAQEALGKYKLVSNQVPYSLGNRGTESDILPYCRNNDIRVIAYTPLDKGITPRGQMGHAVEMISRKYGKTPAQVALNYLISKGTIPIPKAAKREQVIENAKSADFELSREELLLLGRS